jgi:hypothetical protein
MEEQAQRIVTEGLKPARWDETALRMQRKAQTVSD